LETGKSTLLQKFELSDKAGSLFRLRVFYAQKSNTYVYRVSRVLSKLYVVDGLE
jgi:hypothetical protein